MGEGEVRWGADDDETDLESTMCGEGKSDEDCASGRNESVTGDLSRRGSSFAFEAPETRSSPVQGIGDCESSSSKHVGTGQCREPFGVTCGVWIYGSSTWEACSEDGCELRRLSCDWVVRGGGVPAGY
jgi:hypothetical protein